MLALAVAMLARAAPGEATSRADAGVSTKTHYVVAAIGDSLTDARSHGGKYLEYLAEHCPKSRFDNYGHGGEMVGQMRARFARDVLGDEVDPTHRPPRYTHVIIFGGVNDICSDETAGRTPEKITSDLAFMYETAQRHGIKSVALTLSPWGGFGRMYNARRGASTRAVNRWILSESRHGGVDHVVDTYALLSCGDPERLCEPYASRDGLHLNAEGHRKLGEALLRQVFSDCE